MKKIFLSYARKDSLSALKLKEALVRHNYDVWIDLRRISPGQDLSGEIEEAIRQSDYFFVCLTQDVKRKDSFVRREIAYAINQDKTRREINTPGLPIVPILFKGGELPVLIANMVAFDLSNENNFTSNISNIIAYINSKQYTRNVISYHDNKNITNYLQELHEWTSKLLQQSVHKLMNLKAKNTPSAVTKNEIFEFTFATSPIRTGKTSCDTEDQHFDKGKVIFNTFQDAFHHFDGRLLLLGEPGAGKTITLLAFARDAAVERLNNPDAPIPIIATIHTWDLENVDLREWAFGKESIIKFFGEKFLFLLDGLDELGSSRHYDIADENSPSYDPRARFLQDLEINLQNELVVVTCRKIDYFEIGEMLSLEGAITLQPLVEAQIEDFLSERKQQNLFNTLVKDKNLLELARNPLLLSLMSISFMGIEEKYLDSKSLNEAGIFEQYIRSRFRHESSKPEPLIFNEEQTVQMLGYLAISENHIDMRNIQLLDVSLRVTFTYKFAFKKIGAIAKTFLNFCVRMHFLKELSGTEPQFTFIHLKFRDYCSAFGAVQYLSSSEPLTRDRANVLLRSVEHPSVIPFLTKLTRKGDLELRRLALRIIGRIINNVQNSNSNQQLLISLVDKLSNDPDSNIRLDCVWIISQIGERLKDRLVVTLKDNDPKIRSAAIKSYIDLDGVDNNLKLIREMLEDSNPEISLNVVSALSFASNNKTAEVNEILKRAISNKHEIARTTAAEILIDNGYIDDALEVYQNHGSKEKIAILYGLSNLKKMDSSDLFFEAMTDHDADVCVVAIKLVGIKQPTHSERHLAAALLREENRIKSEAAFQLGELKAANHIPELIDCFENANHETRISIIKALDKMRHPQAVPFLEKCLDGKNHFIARLALSCLKGLEREVHSRAIPFLNNKLQSNNYHDKIFALHFLSKIKDLNISTYLKPVLESNHPEAFTLATLRILSRSNRTESIMLLCKFYFHSNTTIRNFVRTELRRKNKGITVPYFLNYILYANASERHDISKFFQSFLHHFSFNNLKKPLSNVIFSNRRGWLVEFVNHYPVLNFCLKKFCQHHSKDQFESLFIIQNLGFLLGKEDMGDILISLKEYSSSMARELVANLIRVHHLPVWRYHGWLHKCLFDPAWFVRLAARKVLANSNNPGDTQQIHSALYDIRPEIQKWYLDWRNNFI